MAHEVVLNVARRTETGKQAAKRVRTKGMVPCVLYGSGEAPVVLEVDRKELTTVLHSGGRNVIVDLAIGDDASDGIKTIVKEIQHHPIGGHILHVDFQHISLTQKVRVEVPVVSFGVARGVKDGGGVLEHHLHHLEIECLATEIPEQIRVNVTALNIGDSIHVSDLLETEPRIVTEADRSVLTIVAPVVSKVSEEEGAEEVSSSEPEVIRRERKTEEEGD